MADGFFYAPDPSSQLACTIAGNIGMNSGGAHCLKYGVTTNNVLGVRLVLVDGTIVEIGGDHLDSRRPRSSRPDHRLGRPARHRHRGDRAHPAFGGRRAAGAVRLSDERRGRRLRRRHHRRRHHPGRDRIHGQAGDRDLRGLRPCRLSPGRRGAADHRGRRLRRGDGDAARKNRRDRQEAWRDDGARVAIGDGSRGDLEGPQIRVRRDRPHCRLHLHGRHGSDRPACREVLQAHG